MGKEQGYIKLYRSLLSDELWLINEPFSKRDAWIDLLLSASYKENVVIIGNQTVNVNVGDVITSLKGLSERWRWSTTKVNAFLKLLEKNHKIVIEKNLRFVVINLRNFGRYQDSYTPEKNQKKFEKNLKSNRKKYIQESKEVNNIYIERESNIISTNLSSPTLALGRHKNILLTQAQYDEYKSRYPYIDEVIEELSDAIDVDPQKFAHGDVTSWLNKFIRQRNRHTGSSGTVYKDLN